jgi:RNA 3'-terminal phosphate cyclase (ATP)
MGAQVQLTIRRHGFYPAGGGEIVVDIEPCPQLQPLQVLERGAQQTAYAQSWLAALPAHIGERELATVRDKMGWSEEQTQLRSVRAVGHGNILLLVLEHEHVTNVFSAFGEYGVSAEKVAGAVCKEAKAFLHSHAAVDEYLADQLLLPIALAGKGSFTTTYVSSHCESNMAVIQAFLPVSFAIDVLSRDTVRISLC